MVDLKQIRDIVYQIFSSSGYSLNNMNIQFPQPLDIKITKKNESIMLDFISNIPKVSMKKFITITAYVKGLDLHPNGGTLKLRYLPDINFDYGASQELMFGQYMDFSSIEEEIASEYKDEERKKLASRCLQYGREWATIASQNPDFAQSSVSEQKRLKQQCKNFIRDNIKNEEEQKYGSAILMFILIYVLLPVVLKFIVERIFKKLFNN